MTRNYPAKRTCPHCGDTEATVLPPVGDYTEYQCLDCGTYRVSDTMERLIANGTVDPMGARIEERGGFRLLVSP
jgi:hypothetical protein